MAEFQPTFSTALPSVSVNEIYGSALYRPDSLVVDSAGAAKHTLEALNGGLTSRNLGLSTSSEVFRAGSFARGYYYGFNSTDHNHASQFGPDYRALKDAVAPSNKSMVPHQSLAASFWCPWNATAIISIQGFFGGRVTKIPSGRFSSGPLSTDFHKAWENLGESWRFRLSVNGQVQHGSRFFLASTRKVATVGYFGDGSEQAGWKAPGSEYRFRWHQRTRIVSLKKGYNSVALMVWPGVLMNYTGDTRYNAPRLQTYCGGISLLAMKRGGSTADVLLSEAGTGGSGHLEYYERQIDVPSSITDD